MSADYGGDVDYLASTSAVLSVNVQSSNSGQPGNSSGNGSAGSAGSTPPGTNSTIPPPSGSAHPVKPLTRAQQLAKALKLCRHKKPRSKRKTCEARAKKRYKVKAK
jgi:hypothetical protein